MQNLSHIQPIVLVGGKSSRFGSDKLRAIIGQDENGPVLMVHRPIAALRAIFGPRVMLVGACDFSLQALADSIIKDRYPGQGPAGGILSALEATARDVFVLPGDLPRITAQLVLLILARAEQHPDALIVMAQTDRPEPCVALYRTEDETTSALRRHIADPCRGPLHAAVPESRRVMVPCDRDPLTNVNRKEDLA